jgi:hypothetical protein
LLVSRIAQKALVGRLFECISQPFKLFLGVIIFHGWQWEIRGSNLIKPLFLMALVQNCTKD